MEVEETNTDQYKKLVNLIQEISFIPSLEQKFPFIYRPEICIKVHSP